jgi:erythromycin esterase-like protein
MAGALDQASRAGVDGIAAFCKRHPPGPPFYSWRNEAELLARVRAATPESAKAFWGIDYEIYWQDRFLLDQLRHLVPAPAKAAFEQLDRASKDAWERYRGGTSFVQLYGVNGNPSLIEDLRKAWSRPDLRSMSLMQALLDTVETNKLFLERKGYASNQRRSATMRRNLLDYFHALGPQNQSQRLLFKMGVEHLTRGTSAVGTFDVGSLIPEWSAEHGRSTFSIVALAAGGTHSVVDPGTFRSTPAPVADFADEFAPSELLGASTAAEIAVLDLRALRPKAQSPDTHSATARYINGYDALVVFGATTADPTLI